MLVISCGAKGGRKTPCRGDSPHVDDTSDIKQYCLGYDWNEEEDDTGHDSTFHNTTAGNPYNAGGTTMNMKNGGEVGLLDFEVTVQNDASMTNSEENTNTEE